MKPSPNRIILACAGSGKSTSIVDEAFTAPECRSALVTYTINGTEELRKIAHERHRHIPSHVTISTWFAFLLKHFVRPYQNALYEPRVGRINFNQGISAKGVPATNIARHYFSQPGVIYRDKLTKFACELNRVTDGRPIRRFRQLFDRLYIDEAQDISGPDLDLIELLLKSDVEIVLVGDSRQATYTTNDSPRNKQYARANIVKKFEEWKAAGLCSIDYRNESRRCIQPICDFADQFFPDQPRTKSLNIETSDHDGVFVIREAHVEAYRRRFNPQSLRYNIRFEASGKSINFGAAKGMTFERTLIYPHGPLKKFIGSADLKDAGKELAKLYVAVTRAKQSVAFVLGAKDNVSRLSLYVPPSD